MTYNELFIAMAKYFSPKQLKYVFASHADPDIIASLPRWLTGSETKLLISAMWSRFVPHCLAQGARGHRAIFGLDRIAVLRSGPDDTGNVQASTRHAHFTLSHG